MEARRKRPATPKRVLIHTMQRVYDGFFKVDRAEVSYEKYDGSMSSPAPRLVFERGDSVAVLPFDRCRRRVVLVQQFRFPAYVRGGPGWLWEIVAGMVEGDRSVEDVARSEATEEAGYSLGALKHLFTVYPSPGGSSERVHIYLAPVGRQDSAGEGSGPAASGEDILVRTFDLDEALRMIEDGRIVDAKTVLALQYLAMHWDQV